MQTFTDHSPRGVPISLPKEINDSKEKKGREEK